MGKPHILHQLVDQSQKIEPVDAKKTQQKSGLFAHMSMIRFDTAVWKKLGRYLVLWIFQLFNR